MELETIRKDNGMSFIYWKESIQYTMKNLKVEFPEEHKDLIDKLYFQNWTASQVLNLFRNPVVKGKITIEIEDQSGSQLTKDFYSFDSIRTFLVKHPAARIYFRKKATFR